MRIYSIILFAVLALSLPSCSNRNIDESDDSAQETSKSNNVETTQLQSDLQSWGISIPDTVLTITNANRDLWKCVIILDKIVTQLDSNGTDRQVWTTRAYEMFFVEQRPLTAESISEFFREKSGKGR